jgi:hypothetical protein
MGLLAIRVFFAMEVLSYAIFLAFLFFGMLNRNILLRRIREDSLGTTNIMELWKNISGMVII